MDYNRFRCFGLCNPLSTTIGSDASARAGSKGLQLVSDLRVSRFFTLGFKPKGYYLSFVRDNVFTEDRHESHRGL
ncbi:hypothetical protein GQ457_HM001720 [Hibiscus cannabinus]